jgi:gliding motility-associated-like protein
MTFGAPGLQYYWTFDSLDFSTARSPSYKFPDGITANYAVTLMATDTSTGCSGMYEREISIRPELLVYIPNAFTPDGDGLNDLWGPVMQNIDRNTYRLTVFDRYGEIVFETRDVDQKWRGDNMGSEFYVQSGVYVWLIETKNKTSLEEFELKGIVTVVR